MTTCLRSCNKIECDILAFERIALTLTSFAIELSLGVLSTSVINYIQLWMNTNMYTATY